MTELEKAENALEAKYLDKFVQYLHNGDDVFGRVDRICIDNSRKPNLVIVCIDMKRYQADVDEFPSLITLL